MITTGFHHEISKQYEYAQYTQMKGDEHCMQNYIICTLSLSKPSIVYFIKPGKA